MSLLLQRFTVNRRDIFPVLVIAVFLFSPAVFAFRHKRQTFRNPKLSVVNTGRLTYPQGNSSEEVTAHFRLTHRHAHFPGSSHKRKDGSITWDHFAMMKRHDKARYRHLTHFRKRGRRASEQSGGANFPLQGSSDPMVSGLYWTHITLGSPPGSRRYSVQVDTGSDLLWMQCQPCDNCPTHSDITTLAEPFDPSKSPTYRKTPCGSHPCNALQQGYSLLGKGCLSTNRTDPSCLYQLQYGDGSVTRGFLGTDVMGYVSRNGKAAKVPVLFGCGFDQSGALFESGSLVDGILGLGKGEVSVPSQFGGMDGITATFGHCLGGEVKGGGWLALGADVLQDGMVYTPFADTDGMFTSNYYVPISGLVVGSTRLSNVGPASFGDPLSGGGAIFDSGTTLAVLPDDVYSYVAEEVAANTNLEQIPFRDTSNQWCWNYNSKLWEDLSKHFPNITFVFDDASMELEPSNYMLVITATNGEDKAACIAWEPSSLSGIPITVIGDIILRNKLVVYDNTLQRVGWKSMDCS